MAHSSNRQKDIFLKALELSAPEDRAAYLSRECGSDAELRAQIEAMLKAQAAHDSFLEKPAAAMGLTLDAPNSAKTEIADESSASVGPGTRIGNYKLLQQIGAGGMGVVYMAEQQEPVRRKVALKIIKPGMDSSQIIARFEAERQALAMMEHQNIARVLDAGTTAGEPGPLSSQGGGRPYFVMELVHGVPITQFCDDCQLSPRQRLELFIPVCQAVQHAHQKGIIHRDIKPSNILVTMYDDKPVPKVIDFGVAKAVEQRLTEKTLFTQYGALVGTLEYMSPEQAEMNAFGVDTRSDIYSLGVLLYELLTGTTPLEKATVRAAALNEVVRLIKEEEPPRPSVRLSSSGTLAKIAAARKMEPAQLSKLVRGDLDWIVMRALEKDRTRRYDSASGLARDVERYLKDEAVEACPPSASYLLRKFIRKHQKGLATAAAFLALLVVAAGISLWQAVRATKAEVRALAEAADRQAALQIADANRAAAEISNKKAQQERDEAQKARAELRRTLYAASMNLIPAAWEANNYRRVRQILEQQSPGADEDLRGFEWHYWKRLCHAEIRSWQLAQHLSQIAVNSDRTRLAASAASAALHKEQEEPSYGVKVWDLADGRELLSLGKNGTLVPLQLDLNQDGTRLVILDALLSVGNDYKQATELRIVDVATGKVLFSSKTAIKLLALSADGKRLAVTVGKRKDWIWPEAPSQVEVWDAVTGAPLLVLEGGPLHVKNLAFSPDGTRLICETVPGTGNNFATVLVCDAATGKIQHTLSQPDRHLHHVAFTADGRHQLAIAWHISSQGEVKRRSLCVWDMDGKLVRTALLEGPLGWNPTHNPIVANPNGTLLAACDKTSGHAVGVIWDAASGEVRQRVHGQEGFVAYGTFGAHGKRLYLVNSDGNLKMYDATIDQRPRPTPKFTQADWMVQSHDGALRAVYPFTFAQKPGPNVVTVHDRAGKELASFSKHSGRIHSVRFSPDGRLIASTASNMEVMVWEATTGKLCWQQAGDAKGDDLPVFSAKGNRLAVPGSNRVTILDTSDCKEILVVPEVFQHFSGDGTRLTTWHGETARAKSWRQRLWDVDTGKTLVTVDNNKLSNFCYSDRYFVAVINDKRHLKIWDASSGAERITVPCDEAVGTLQGMQFSPDDRYVAVAAYYFGRDGVEILLWDLSPGAGAKGPRHLQGHPTTITSIAFSPNSKRLASITSKGELKLWDLATGAEVLQLKATIEPGGPLPQLSFSKDGHRLFARRLPRRWPEPDVLIADWDATPLRPDVAGGAGR